MPPRKLQEVFPVDRNTQLSVAFLRSLVTEIGNRLATFEILREAVDEVVRAGQDIALERVNEILGPAQAELAARLAAADDKLAAIDTAISEAAALRDELAGGIVSVEQVTGALAGNENLSDLADVAAARANLGAPSARDAALIAMSIGV